MTSYASSEPIGAVVRELVDAIGGPNVAFIGCVRRTSDLGHWINGTSVPDSDATARLTLALRAIRLLQLRLSDGAIRAWLHGSNALLQWHSPIAVLGTERPSIAEANLLAAAAAASSL